MHVISAYLSDNLYMCHTPLDTTPVMTIILLIQLAWISESTVTLGGEFEASGAQGIHARQLLALIYSSDQLIRLQTPEPLSDVALDSKTCVKCDGSVMAAMFFES